MMYTNVYLGMFYLPLEKWISKNIYTKSDIDSMICLYFVKCKRTKQDNKYDITILQNNKKGSIRCLYLDTNRNYLFAGSYDDG